MATIVGFDSLTFTGPVNSSDATAYYGYSVQCSGGEERLSRWTFPGVDGQSVKKGGANPEVVTLTGHIEGSSLANMITGKNAVDAKKIDQTAATLNLWGGADYISTCIITQVSWGSVFTATTGRYCIPFSITWESTG